MATSAASRDAASNARRSERRRSLVAILAAMLLSALFGAAVNAAGARADDQLPVVGTFDWGYTPNSNIPPMWIDSQLRMGVLETQFGDFRTYDLEHSKPGPVIAGPAGGFNNANVGQGSLAAVDDGSVSGTHRIFFPANPPSQPCGVGPNLLYILDLEKQSWTTKDVPCYAPIQGATVDNFAIDSLSYYPPTNKLYAIGMSASEANPVGVGSGITPLNQARESTIIRELDADTLAVGWEVDAGSACDWHRVSGFGGSDGALGSIARAGQDVILYCHKGGRQGQGEVVDIPLDAASKPKTANGTVAVHSMAAVSVSGVPVVIDPASGHVLVTAANAPYGPAVWGYDGPGQRVLGVAPTGTAGYFFSGFDSATGRLYLHDARGVVVVDGRHSPLPGGTRYDTLDGDHISTYAGFNPVMPIDSVTHRLLVPDYENHQYLIVEDKVPVVADACADKPQPCPDPDQGTADIPEVPGQTDRIFSAAANAFGVHVLSTSGTNGAIQNLGPGASAGGVTEGSADCVAGETIAGLPSLFPGACVSTVALSPGDREGFLAQTSVAQGSSLGSSAFASAGRAAPNDHATDADIRELGACQSDRVADLTGQGGPVATIAANCNYASAPAPLREAVNQTPLGPTANTYSPENLRKGTRRQDGSEFPVNGSLCVDFGGNSGSHDSPDPSPQIGASSVTCDASKFATTASAKFASPAIPDISKPSISIAHATSDTTTSLTAEGAVTTATATAEGINIAGFSIGRVVTTATTKAHGRTATTKADYTRVISDVHGPGIDCATTCDPQQVVDAMNKAFSPRLQAYATPPNKQATPHGYTAVISKDPGQHDSDSLLNDDDTLTFDGLDLVAVNDNTYADTNGKPGGNRSRLVLGLAGVQTESHYGVFSAEQGGDSGGTPPTPATPDVPPTPDTPPMPGSSFTIPPTVTPPAHTPGIDGLHLAGSSHVPPKHKNAVQRFLNALRHPLETLKKFWALIISHPMQAVLVFLLLGMFGTPVYLALRRRRMARALAV